MSVAGAGIGGRQQNYKRMPLKGKRNKTINGKV
ncbi:hypothetical protein FOCG_02629 [Fusarium oxysporum f. sp. radicis-lycopersici 26381]|uniref:Uncharacterized protein n=2 Tax=Fusarium oxysporum TaxID=5507 RepID=W9IRR2_FUSOX|nr:hypothetical protein FOYG_04855 [Fusarium oxysporum NRRL 32931]EWZ42197.1 hypothetical protein FOZG_07214 [Fusarium oxysporum Fo47]EXA00701.1 hypothetical protein FOWG_00829 [Fusarium oxysporum f. sp. lycopersici MN25]EXL59385.1 hypothetical protein FOCG_02629 [Fusarium oxysporum f. sp. radicis-lycopersici 26381]